MPFSSDDTQPFLPVTADIHSHTFYSHGKASPQAMVEAARKKGLRIFGFSEHSPRPAGYAYPKDYQPHLLQSFPRYIEEVTALVPEGKKQGIRVLLGLETDYIPGHEAFAKSLQEAHSYDYIIGGLHFQGTWGFDFSPESWEGLDTQECYAAYARYYQDVTAMCRTGLFHIAAPPDLIKIFTKDTFDTWLATKEARESVEEALTAICDAGMLMEVSSAGLRKPCAQIYPGPVIMRMAFELGVPISFGSDAHCADTPAFAFTEMARYAAAFGYRESHIMYRGTRETLPFTPSPVL